MAVAGRARPPYFAPLPFLMLLAALAVLAGAASLASAATESEPNDDSSHANAVPLGVEVQGTSTYRDLDWFAFAIPGPGLLDFTLTGGAPAAGFYNTTLEPIPSARSEPYGQPVFYGVVLKSSMILFVQLTPYAPSIFRVPGMIQLTRAVRYLAGTALEIGIAAPDPGDYVAEVISTGGGNAYNLTISFFPARCSSATPSWWRANAPTEA